MAIAQTLGCIYFTGCLDGKKYVKYPETGVVFELIANGAVQVTDQAIIDAVMPPGCDEGTVEFWTYVTYNPAVHLPGEPPVGDGSEANPWEIPLPPTDDDTVTSKHVEGDTLPIDVTLADGSVVSAGDPLPANVCVVIETDGSGNVVSDTVFEVNAGDADTNHTPEVYLPGDVVAYDITLPDGSVVSAGDPLPDGYCAFLEIDDDGNVVEQDVQVKTASTSDCCDFEYVAYDGDVHIDGDAAAGDGTAAAPIQIPLPPDLCEALNGLEAGDPCVDLSTVNLVTSDCEILPASDILPNHILSKCESLTEVVAQFSPAEPQGIASKIEYPGARGNIGSLVIGASSNNAIPAAAIQPLTINIPAASTTDCVQFVEIGYGGHPVFGGESLIQNGSPFAASVGATTGDVGAISLAVDQGAWTEFENTVTQLVFAVNPTGTGGGTIDFTFPSAFPNPADGEYSGVLNWTVWEVCPNSGTFDESTLAVSTSVIANGAVNGSGPYPADSAIDFGVCDAVYFGVSRHVNGSGGVHEDADWSTTDNPAVVEVTDKASVGGTACQLGTTSGWIPGGSGPVTFSSLQNATVFARPFASWTGLAMQTCDAGSGGGFYQTSKCSQTLVNDCNQTGELSAEISGVIDIVAVDNSTANYCVTPVVNGVRLTNLAQNIYGSDSKNVAFSWSDPGVISPNSSTDVDVCFYIEQKTGDAGDVVTMQPVTVCAEITHI